MDDITFNDPIAAQDWITTVESERGRVREQDIYPQLNAWVGQGKSSRILDIGCGQGICSDKIDLAGISYVGVEPSPTLVERARGLYAASNREFVLGSVYQLPFGADAFDAAFSVAVWHLLGDLGKAARELSRVLKLDGRFKIITANPAAYALWTESYTDSKLVGRRFEGRVQLQNKTVSHDVLYLHPWNDIETSLRTVGLDVVRTDTFRASEKSKGQGLYLSIEGMKIRPTP